MKKNNDSDLVKFTVYDFMDIFNWMIEVLYDISDFSYLLGGKEE